MLESQTHLIRISELRTKINDHDGEDADELTKLENESRALEAKYRVAVKAEAEAEENSEADGSAGELRELVAAANIGAIFEAAVESRATTGAEKELQDSLNLAPNAAPLDLLRLEKRAVTPAPASVGAMEAPTVQPVFAMGDAEFLGVMETMVDVGDAVFPVLTTRPTVGGPHRESENVAETDGTYAVSVLPPSRLQASFLMRATDAVRFRDMQDSLSDALRSGLGEAVDKEIVDQLSTDVARTAATAADTFASYRKRFIYDLIDGRFASMESDIRLLVGSKTLADASELYRANTADDSVLDSIRRISGGVKVSPHIAAVAASKQDVYVRKGMHPDFALGMWRGVTLLVDPYSGSKKGEVRVTGTLLAAFKTVRVAGFAVVQSQHV